MRFNHMFRYVIPFFAAFSLIACEDDSISGTAIQSYPIDPSPGTQQPGTQEPGTQQPGTQQPGTQQPGTQEPGTQEPGTQEPGTQEPGTQEPGTQEPGTQEPGTQEPGTQEPGTQEPGTQEPGTQEPGTQEPGTQEPTDPENSAILMAASATDIEIAYNGFTKAQVILVGIAGEHAGEGLIGEDVSWAIESGNDIVTLSARSSTTGAGGITNMSVSSLGQVGEAVIVASSELAANPVKFNVTVLPKPTGAMRVTAKYSGPAQAHLANYSIALYDGKEVQCAMIDLKNGVEAEPLLPRVDEDTALFEDLDIEQRYSLIAYGYAQSGAMVAAGCLDSGLNITQDNVLNVTINLDTIALDPISTYHVRSYFDLGDVVGAFGKVGSFITGFAAFVNDPSGFVYDKALDLVKAGVASVLPSWVASALGWGVDKVLEMTGVKDDLEDWIKEQITSSSAACKAGLFSCQLTNLIQRMEFTGNFSVEQIGSIELRGEDTYTGLAAYWRMNCSDSDPNCGRYSFSSDQVGLGNDVKFLEGMWEGSLANGYDKLSVESHTLELRYGEVIMFLINHLLLPKVANGATSFDEAIAYWINRDGFANWLHNTIKINTSIYSWQLSEEKAQSIANGLVSTLTSILNFASAFAELQTAGSDIEISGTALFVDTNADNTVDIINGGKWSGSMTIKTEEDGVKVTKTTAVRGIWSAYNKENVLIDGTNIYCTYPKTIDADGRLCDFPEIDLNALNGSNMCATYKNCAGN